MFLRWVIRSFMDCQHGELILVPGQRKLHHIKIHGSCGTQHFHRAACEFGKSLKLRKTDNPANQKRQVFINRKLQIPGENSHHYLSRNKLAWAPLNWFICLDVVVGRTFVSWAATGSLGALIACRNNYWWNHGKGACAPASKKRIFLKHSLSWNALTGDTGGKGEVQRISQSSSIWKQLHIRAFQRRMRSILRAMRNTPQGCGPA